MMKHRKRPFIKRGFLLIILLTSVTAGLVCGRKIAADRSRLSEKPQRTSAGTERDEAAKAGTDETTDTVINADERTEPAAGAETETDISPEPDCRISPQPGACLISEEEKEELQNEALAAAESVSVLYREGGIAETPGFAAGIGDIGRSRRRAVVEELGKNGLVSVEKDTNMQNYEAVETFYREYQSGNDCMVTVFEVYSDGQIGAMTFICRGSRLQTFYVGIRWKEGGIPEIQGTSVSDVARIRLTEKGYFIYAYETMTAHGGLCQYWRVRPLSDKCRELTEKYIAGLSYVNYNMLITNWDSSNVEDILMPCMFEDIYRIYTGENLRTENQRIPAAQYEKIMTTCFPVSAGQLRQHCGYDENDDSYAYEMIFSSQYPPFGEVVDYRSNAEGTITLTVDGVWPDYDSDQAFVSQIVVRPFADGTFCYLSNSIKPKELEIPLIPGVDDE